MYEQLEYRVSVYKIATQAMIEDDGWSSSVPKSVFRISFPLQRCSLICFADDPSLFFFLFRTEQVAPQSSKLN